MLSQRQRLSVAASVASVMPKGNPEAAKIKNPVASTPESIAAGKKTYDTICASCHGADAKGRDRDLGHRGPGRKAAARSDRRQVGSRIERRRDLHRHQEGRPPDFFMAPWDGRITDTDIWNMINYIRSLAQKEMRTTSAPAVSVLGAAALVSAPSSAAWRSSIG